MQICNLNESNWGVQELIDLFRDLDEDFDPPFRTRIESFELFAKKLFRLGQVHVAFDSKKIIGAIGYYCNDWKTKKGYISYLAIRNSHRGKGIANDLLRACVEAVKKTGMQKIIVRSDIANTQAIEFYKSFGFSTVNKISVSQATEGKLFFELFL